MEFNVRPYGPSDRIGFNNVRSKVYRNGEPIPDDEELVPQDGIGTVVEFDGKIVGAATGIGFETEFWGSRIRTLGVAAVGVLPEWRRTGAGAALMRGAHKQYAELGFDMAALYPFRAAFYRKFGYEYSGYWLKIKAKPDQIHVVGDLLPVRELSETKAIRPVYDSFAGTMNGMSHRNDLQWERTIGKDKPCAIYVAGDPIEAYAVVRLESTFWVPQAVKEVVATTKRGYASILSFLKGLGNNKTELEWLEPADSRFLNYQAEQGMHVARDAQVMWRALNVGSLLRKLTIPSGGSASLAVSDPEIAANNGTWLLMNSSIEFAEKRLVKPDVSVSIGHFTQMALGQPSFKELADQELVSVENPATVERFSEIFPSKTVCHADWY